MRFLDSSSKNTCNLKKRIVVFPCIFATNHALQQTQANQYEPDF